MPPMSPADQPPTWSIESLYAYFSRVVQEVENRAHDKAEVLEKLRHSERETLNTAIKAVENTAQAALNAAREEARKAEKNIETRFAGQNEWRGTVQDILSTAIPRKEVEQLLAGVTSQLNEHAQKIGAIESKGSGIQSAWGILVTVITLAALIFGAVVAFKK